MGRRAEAWQEVAPLVGSRLPVESVSYGHEPTWASASESLHPEAEGQDSQAWLVVLAVESGLAARATCLVHGRSAVASQWMKTLQRFALHPQQVGHRR